MGRVTDSTLFGLIHDFLKVYLPKQKKCSVHTIRAYQLSLEQLLDYVKEQNQIALADVTFEMLNQKAISGFLDWLEDERGCTVSTRNHKLKGIRSFFAYAAKMDSTTVIFHIEMRKVPRKKSVESDLIKHMSPDAVSALLAQPDAKTRKGLRDQCFMIMMYDAGARLQEMLGLRLRDICLGKTPTITLTGKWSKVRSVPLMESTVKHLQQYLKVFHPDANRDSDQLLFYVVRNGSAHTISGTNIRNFMEAYGRRARQSCPHVHEKVHPHLLRHSRAMHLYQQGMDLTLVSQWLGHASVQTTLIYAHADTEQKRSAIEKATAAHDLLRNIPITAPIDTNDENVLKRLYGLK